jgi:mannosyltransferase OCH1-like enzyme
MYKNLIIIVIIIILIYININTINEKFSNSINKIPKIIIQTWKEENIPKKYYNDIKSLMKNNKDYEYIFFTDNNIEKFLQDNYSEYYKTYKKLPYKIQKIDFFRYIAIYHYGGFYFDLDISGLLPLDDLLKYDVIFPIDLHLKNDCNDIRTSKFCDNDNNNLKINYLLGQYAFAATKNNKFIKYIIDGIHINIDKYIDIIEKEKDKDFDREIYIYKTTGPDYITEMYLNYDDKENIFIIKNKDNYQQYFGDYAQHNYYGTWK